jgi:hypothetical protein
MRKRDDSGTHPDPRTDAAREARLRSLFAAADPMDDPSTSLTERITQLRLRRAEPAKILRPRMRPVLRWCALGMTCAALVGVWATGRRDNNSAVATAIRATASAPALHVHGGGKHERQELWYVEGVGIYGYDKNDWSQSPETIWVDDMRRWYLYEIRERRVTIRRSLMADPKHWLLFWENHSGTGMLNQLRAVVGPQSIREETAVRDGRAVRKVIGPFTGPRWVNRFTIDAETDRILSIETNRPKPDGTIDRVRFIHEYPDPRDVDRRYFRFEIPKGVTVIDETKK